MTRRRHASTTARKDADPPTRTSDDWPEILARTERWSAYAWRPAPAQHTEALEGATTWRVTAPMTLAIGQTPGREIELEPGTLVLATSRTYRVDGDWGWTSWWATTTRILVLNGRHAGWIGIHDVRDDYEGLGPPDSFVPSLLEPVALVPEP